MDAKPYKYHNRRFSIVSAATNLTGALVTFLYFSAIDPLPTSSQGTTQIDQLAWVIFVGFMVLTLIIGTQWDKKHERQIKEWYEHIRKGNSPDEVPPNIKKLVLNTPVLSLVSDSAMWLLAALFFSYGTNSSSRIFFGILGVGYVLTVSLSFFIKETLWRPIIKYFFPGGNLSQHQAFRLPVMGRLLVAFFLIGIYSPLILTTFTWERAKLLPTVQNPEIILANLQAIQVYILTATIIASIGLAVYITQGITNPLNTLQQAMDKVEENQLDTHVPVTSNDELGELTEHFNKMTAGLRQGEMMRNLLNLYVSPEVAKEALQHGVSLGGEEIECTILFSDIRRFTTLSETLSPQNLIKLLNEYMTAMIEIVVKHGGIVNKFGGDSLLAVYGTPLNPAQDHALKAIQTAQEMLISLNEFNQPRFQKGLPSIRIGVGIASGAVVAGNVGGKERLEYTVIGNAVNLASRLEAKTKELECSILISEETYKRASQSNSLKAIQIKDVEIRGLKDPINIYQM